MLSKYSRNLIDILADRTVDWDLTPLEIETGSDIVAIEGLDFRFGAVCQSTASLSVHRLSQRAATYCSGQQAPMYIVETARLGLRRLQESDLDDFHAIWSNDNATRWTSYDVSHTLEDSKVLLGTLSASLEKPEPQNYGVFLRNSSREFSAASLEKERMIGVVGVFRSTAAEVGYIFNESFWNQGYASESLTAFLDIHWQRATADASLPQAMTARVDPGNPASVKVLRKCGFQDIQCLMGDKESGGKDLLLLQVEKPVGA